MRMQRRAQIIGRNGESMSHIPLPISNTIKQLHYDLLNQHSKKLNNRLVDNGYPLQAWKAVGKRVHERMKAFESKDSD